MKTFKAAILGGLFLLGAAMPGTALAATDTAAAEPGSRLTLSVTTGSPGRTVTVELTCDPDGGTHPNPVAACSALRTASGDVTAMVIKDVQCIGLYDPHTVQMTGHWQGREVSYEQKFGNACHMEAATGPLFVF